MLCLLADMSVMSSSRCCSMFMFMLIQLLNIICDLIFLVKYKYYMDYVPIQIELFFFDDNYIIIKCIEDIALHIITTYYLNILSLAYEKIILKNQFYMKINSIGTIQQYGEYRYCRYSQLCVYVYLYIIQTTAECTAHVAKLIYIFWR